MGWLEIFISAGILIDLIALIESLVTDALRPSSYRGDIIALGSVP